jgi:uncharacterized repeat protein (TIGR01451 family)
MNTKAFVKVVVGLALVIGGVAIPVSAASAGGGNNAAAHACQQGGWQRLLRADGTSFKNTGDCVSYGAPRRRTGVLPPDLMKDFTPSTIQLNGVSELDISILNRNDSALTGVTFTDTLPPGLVFTTPISFDTCGGTVVVTTTLLTFTGGTIAGGAACGIFLGNVRGTTPGAKVNTTSSVTSNEADPGTPATATLVVGSP